MRVNFYYLRNAENNPVTHRNPTDLEHVLKCNVYCTSVDKFAAVNAVYARHIPPV
jgi:enamine deaminase RidA (YjgF/YER057c/UK114 family)